MDLGLVNQFLTDQNSQIGSEREPIVSQRLRNKHQEIPQVSLNKHDTARIHSMIQPVYTQ